jgi:hypothetical protein
VTNKTRDDDKVGKNRTNRQTKWDDEDFLFEDEGGSVQKNRVGRASPESRRFLKDFTADEKEKSSATPQCRSVGMAASAATNGRLNFRRFHFNQMRLNAIDQENELMNSIGQNQNIFTSNPNRWMEWPLTFQERIALMDKNPMPSVS